MADNFDEIFNSGDLDQQSGKSKNIFRIPGHLREPITCSEVNFLLTNQNEPRMYCKRHISLINYIKKLEPCKSIYENCPSPWACLLASFTTEAKKLQLIAKEKIMLQLTIILEAAILNWAVQKTAYLNSDTAFLSPELHTDIIKEVLSSPEIVTAFFTKIISEKYKDKVTEQDFEPGDVIEASTTMTVDKEVFFWRCPLHPTKIVIGPTPLLLGALDILQTRFGCLLHWKLADIFSKYINNPARQHISIFSRGNKIIKLIESLYSTAGEDTFSIIKLWEPYVIGVICTGPENTEPFEDLYVAIKKEFRELEQKYSLDLSSLRKLFINRHRLTDVEVHIALELTGLTKCFGHPIIDPTEGIEAVRDIAGRQIKIDMKFRWRVRSMFVRTFCKNYYFKHKRWPNLSYISCPDKDLYQHISAQTWPLDKTDTYKDLPRWNCIRFKKTFDFDTVVDTADIISDKSSAPSRSKWAQGYDPCAFKLLYNKPKPFIKDPDETRVVIRYLKGSKGEVKKEILNIITNKPDPENDIVQLCVKERELKKKGRMFCKQRFNQGLIQKAKEMNINNFVNKYIREQTMSDGELRLKRRIAIVQKSLERGDSEIMNADLFRWNLLQRHLSNVLIADIIDDLFATPGLYHDSHLWMQRCMVLSNDRVNPPDYDLETNNPIPGPSCHYNQYGGFEGMLQKLWTPSTICIIKLTAEDLDIDIEILGQGDNISTLIKWRPHQKLIQNLLRYQFITQLEINFRKMGLILKKEETWFSSLLFEYGKVRWYKSCPTSAGTKRACRIIPDEHDGVPTTDTSLSIISTATENIALLDWTPDVAFILYGVLTLQQLYRKKVLNLFFNKEQLVAILHFPGILGGINISNFPNHNIRGIEDKLTLWNSLLMSLKKCSPQIFRYLPVLFNLRPRNELELSSLIIDPISINISGIRPPSLIVKDFIKVFLPKFATNPEILDLFNLSANEREELMKTLASMRPLFIKMAHELYRNSNVGNFEHLQSRMYNIQSISKCSRSYTSEDIYELVHTENIKYNLRLRNTFKKMNLRVENQVGCPYFLRFYDKIQCSVKLSNEQRLFYWKLNIAGITKPVPWEQFKVTLFSNVAPPDEVNSILTVLSRELTTSIRDYIYNLGPFSIYIGSMTHTKAVKSKVQYREANPCLISLKQLLFLRAWALKMKSLDMLELVDILLYNKSSLMSDPEILSLLIADNDQIYSGHPYHRFKMLEESGGCLLNYLPAIASHIKSSTSLMAPLSSKGEDYNIFFQEIFLYTQTLISSRLWFFGPTFLEFKMATVLDCNHCTVELDEMQLSISPKLLERLRKKLKTPARSLRIYAGIVEEPKIYLWDPPENIKFTLALSVSILLNEQVEKAFFERQTPVGSDLKIEDSMTFNSINLNEFRCTPLPLVIAFFTLVSREFRADLTAYLTNTEFLIDSRVYRPLMDLVFFSHREHELFRLLNFRPTNYSDCINSSACSKNISRYLATYVRQNFLEMAGLIFQCDIMYYSITSNLSFCKWTVKHFLVAVRRELSQLINTEESSILVYRYQESLDSLFLIERQSEKISYDFAVMLQVLRKHFNGYNIVHPFSIVNKIRCPPLDNVRTLWRTAGCPVFSYTFIQGDITRSSSPVEGPAAIPVYETLGILFASILTSKMHYTVLDPLRITDQIKLTTWDNRQRMICKTLKQLGRPLGSCNKSINSDIVFLYNFITLFLDPNIPITAAILADGSCTSCLTLQHLFPTGTFYPNTLIDSKTYNATDFTRISPPAYLGDPCKLIDDLLRKGEWPLLTGETNILTSRFQTLLKSLSLKQPGRGFSFIHIDLESTDITTYIDLCRALPVFLYCLLEKKHSFLITRMLINSQTIRILKTLLHDIRHFFFKPVVDDQNDNFVYLVISFHEIVGNILDSLANFSISPLTIDDMELISLDSAYLFTAQCCLDQAKEFSFWNYINSLLRERRRILAISCNIEPQCLMIDEQNTFMLDGKTPVNLCVILLCIIQRIITLTWENLSNLNFNKTELLATIGRKKILNTNLRILSVFLSFETLLGPTNEFLTDDLPMLLVDLSSLSVSLVDIKVNRASSCITKLDVQFSNNTDVEKSLLFSEKMLIQLILSKYCISGMLSTCGGRNKDCVCRNPKENLLYVPSSYKVLKEYQQVLSQLRNIYFQTSTNSCSMRISKTTPPNTDQHQFQ